MIFCAVRNNTFRQFRNLFRLFYLNKYLINNYSTRPEIIEGMNKIDNIDFCDLGKSFYIKPYRMNYEQV